MIKSIRQIADELNVSHTTVSTAIKKLNLTFEDVKRGQAKLLDEDQQKQVTELILGKQVNVETKEATAITVRSEAQKVSAPALPVMPDVVYYDVDTSEIDLYNDQLDEMDLNLDSALEMALVGFAQQDAKKMKPKIKSVYKKMFVESRTEVIQDLQENRGA
jgi:hypothetical protein